MNKDQRRRFFQKVKSVSEEQFYSMWNDSNTDAYVLGQKHLIEAMMNNPKIFKPTIREVVTESVRIREEWDNLRYSDEIKKDSDV